MTTRSWQERWVSWGSALALCGGAALGEWLHRTGGSADGWAMAGDLILVRPLMLVVLPLILVSVVSGVTAIGNPARLGLLGGAAIVYFVSTMVAAGALGIVLVTLVGPGNGVDHAQAQAMLTQGMSTFESNQTLASRATEGEAAGLAGAWINILRQLIPTNPFGELVAGRPLGVIGFALLLGAALAVAADRMPAARVARDVVSGLFEALIVAVRWILILLPIGAFCLVASMVARTGLADFGGPLAKYMAVVLGGLFLHALVVLPMVLLMGGCARPWAYLFRCRDAIGTAFFTSSSSATLPVTLETGPKAGASRRATNFVCPLGATVNMDGTALYEAVAVVFLFQISGIPLGTTELIVVVVTATLAAIGAAGIPSAGLVTMALAVSAVNTSLADPAKVLPIAATGFIWGVDRPLDMVRTAVNVWGDLVGARLLTPLALDEGQPGEPEAP